MREPYNLERLVPSWPEWTQDDLHRGSLIAALTGFRWEMAKLLYAIGDALPAEFGGILLLEKAARIKRACIYPPGIDSGEEYGRYLKTLEITTQSKEVRKLRAALQALVVIINEATAAMEGPCLCGEYPYECPYCDAITRLNEAAEFADNLLFFEPGKTP